MGFNWGFKGLTSLVLHKLQLNYSLEIILYEVIDKNKSGMYLI